MTATSEPAVRYCPSCGGRLRPEAVLCVHCGMDLKAGQRRAVEVEQAPRRSVGTAPRALGLAGATGVGLVAIWTALVMLTGWPLGWLAIPIGAVIGLVLADRLGRGGWRWGLAAGGLAAVLLFAGQAIVAAAGHAAVAQRDVQADPAYLQAAIIRSMAQQRAFSPAVQAGLDARVAGEPVAIADLDDQIAREAQRRLAELTPAQHRALARELIADVPAASLSASGLGMVFTRWDAIFLALGAFAAAGATDVWGRRAVRAARSGEQ